jgi:hypothetical protein
VYYPKAGTEGIGLGPSTPDADRVDHGL